MPTLRLAQVIIFDPSEDLPLESRILFKGEEKLTDLTDQELFFELDIQGLLKAHNALRAKTLDKKKSEKMGKELFLEPLRIRDLKMTVIGATLA